MPDLAAFEIRRTLRNNPDCIYISSEGSTIYFLQNDEVVVLTGHDFKAMSEDEINEYICTLLSV